MSAALARRAVSAGLARRAALAAIAALALGARLYRPDLTWYFLDQVRDVSTGAAIASGQSLPLVGPLIGWTSGRLGPLYFYLVAPPFLFSSHPLAGVVWAGLAGALAVLLLYPLARDAFGVPAALAACALFAAFPLAVQSSRALWNPAFVPLFTVLFMRALFALVVRGRSAAVVGLLASFAVLTQLHLTTVPLALVALVAIALGRPRIRIAHALAGAVVVLALYALYLAHELTHRFENVRAILGGAVSGGGGGGERAFLAVVKNLLALDRSVLDGFVVREPWPRGFAGAFSVLYGAEIALFWIGLAVCVTWLIRGSRSEVGGTTPPDRRAVGLLLLWLIVPVVWLGTRRTALWWYYFDVLYPSQFIAAGIGLAWLANARVLAPRARRPVAGAAVGLVVAIAAVQTWFSVGLVRRVLAQGEFVLAVPRLSVAAAPSSLGTLAFLPYAYRERILGALVRDFGLDAPGVASRVHGAVLGRPEENEYILDRVIAPRAARPLGTTAPSDTHYLVVNGDGEAPPSASRSVRVGPYRIYEYRPGIDYAGWSARALPAPGDQRPAEGWEKRPLPARDVATLAHGRRLAWRGSVRTAGGARAVQVVVTVMGDGPLGVTGVESGNGTAALVSQRSWQSPSLYWTTEAVVDVRPAPGADTAGLGFAVEGAGRVLRVDVHERAAPPGHRAALDPGACLYNESPCAS